jgi:threonylcarbamoyladenosine tRNA methylthiotransferase MtaB
VTDVYLKTFGCKVNQADSDALYAALHQIGLRAAPYPSPAQVSLTGALIVNTCCVTAEAERKALQFVRKVRREQPQLAVLLTGCAARNAASNQAYADTGAVLVPWYTDAVAWLHEQGLALPAPGALACELEEQDSGGRTRALLKVQDGCCNYCAYCIVPTVRTFASKPLAAIMTELDRCIAGGKREIVLTGVNIGHYGMTPLWPVGQSAPEPAQYEPTPGQASLASLIEAVLERLPDGFRLRLSSVEPDTVTPHLLELFTHPRMCPHLHMPLQSGSDAVLAAMRRRYTVKQYLALVEHFRHACPSGAVTADILVGFPTETEADFEQTLAACTAAEFERVHGFPFSPRPGTAAAKLRPLERAAVQQRNRSLIAHCRSIADRSWQRFVGQTITALIEELDARGGGSGWLGHGEAYQIVSVGVAPGHALAGCDLTGCMFPVRLETYGVAKFRGVFV